MTAEQAKQAATILENIKNAEYCIEREGKAIKDCMECDFDDLVKYLHGLRIWNYTEATKALRNMVVKQQRKKKRELEIKLMAEKAKLEAL